jgi:transcriptional/translational regulatory protein YebC/TACO1
MNPRLRMAVDAAKKQSMTKDTLERAIKKGAGLLDDGAQFETVVYEGYAPHQVPVIVECLTDNKNRTAPNMRVLFRKGQLGSSGSVSWDFDRRGAVEASPPRPVKTPKRPPSRPARKTWRPATTAAGASSPSPPTWTPWAASSPPAAGR